MRIGVIGSGISGLTAAWALDQEGQDVELLEAGDKVGMAAHSLDLDLDGVTRVGDVPSRMFNRRQWPQLCRLYDRLGVSTMPVDASQTLCDVQGACYLKLDNGLRPGMGASLLWDRHARHLLRAAAALQRDGRRDLAAGLV
ncbi:MAG: FAD-dependent oxidoreductase, partial [Planctomycetota bacterium]|nr:FAD-dependent oxidoreductase [Planctomycetota bacterium]